MIVIRSKDKENYLTALNRSDIVVGSTPSIGAHAELQQITPFLEYMEQCLEHALRTSIKAAKGDSIEENDDFEKQLAILRQTSTYNLDAEGANDTPQNKIDVFNLFHKDFAKRLIDALKPVESFFNSFNVIYYMSKDISSISSKSINLLYKDELFLDISDKEKDIIKDAKSILFVTIFHRVKRVYKMKDISIRIEASVIFELSHYSFRDKLYPYGTYPTQTEINNIISEIKSDVLDKIKKATAELI